MSNTPGLVDANGNSLTPTSPEAPAVQSVSTGVQVPWAASSEGAIEILIKALDAMIAADINLNEVAKKYPDQELLDDAGIKAMQQAFGRSSACHLDLKNCYAQLRPFLLSLCAPSSPSV